MKIYSQQKSVSADSPELSALIKINHWSLPVFPGGVIRDGFVDSLIFLRSAGFFMSGYNDQDELWVNGVQSQFQVRDYIQGSYETGTGVLGVYTVSENSPPFGLEWKFWNAAVELGAEYYDGDNDGEYYPVDKNGNGLWDPDEDKPAIWGNAVAYSVYNDGITADKRKYWDGNNPQGIEVRQTVWGYDNPDLEKVFFIKYSIRNNGNKSNILKDVIFSLCLNPDIGYQGNDFSGFDSTLEAAYVYPRSADFYINGSLSTFSANMIQGPKIKTNNPDDTYYKLSGPNFDLVEEHGARSASINAFSLASSRIVYLDRENFRSYMEGELNPDPCNDNNSVVLNENCQSINYKLQYSGDPIRNQGWILTKPSDQLFCISSEKFDLAAGEEVDIIFAMFVVDENIESSPTETALLTYESARKKNRELKFLYHQPDFTNIPTVAPTVIANGNKIELIWETSEFINSRLKGFRYDLEFEGFQVYMYRNPTPEIEINGFENARLIAGYDVLNHINDIYIENPNDFSVDLAYKKGIQLNNEIYSDPETGRIKLEINRDPFTFGSLIKGQPYFISVSPFYISKKDIVRIDEFGSFLLKGSSLVGSVFGDRQIINSNSSDIGIIIGESENDIYFEDVGIEHIKGDSESRISYSIIDKEEVKDVQYEISFERSAFTDYSVNYSVQNLNNLEYPIISADARFAVEDITSLFDGITLNIEWIDPQILSVEYSGEQPWFMPFDTVDTGVFYIGQDFEEKLRIRSISTKYSDAISFDRTKDVEIRFADSSKAYRYVRRAVRFAWDGIDNVDSGFVTVPFSAYSIDKNGDEKKLAVGFLENGVITNPAGLADGKWNPGTNISLTNEYIIIFDAPYSNDPYYHIAYTGSPARTADIAHGYNIGNDLPNVNDSLRVVANSAWFDAMYVVGFETPVYISNFQPFGTLHIKPSKVLSQRDRYIFKTKSEKTFDEKIKQFNKINVFPNPLLAYNSATTLFQGRTDEPFVTFSNLPVTATIKIYSLGGNLIKTIYKDSLSPMYRWNLQNEYERRIGSGLYIALIENPDLGKKILKFSVIMPQKQVQTN